MTGADALRQIEAAAQREVFLAADLVARALTISSRKLLMDWRRRHLPETKVGRTILLPARQAYLIYFAETVDSGMSGIIDLSHAAHASSRRILSSQTQRSSFLRSSAHV